MQPAAGLGWAARAATATSCMGPRWRWWRPRSRCRSRPAPPPLSYPCPQALLQLSLLSSSSSAAIASSVDAASSMGPKPRKSFARKTFESPNAAHEKHQRFPKTGPKGKYHELNTKPDLQEEHTSTLEHSVASQSAQPNPSIAASDSRSRSGRGNG